MSTLTCKRSLMTAKEYQNTSSEKEIRTGILSYLAARGIEAWINHRGAGLMKNGGFVRWGGRKGSSDILGILPNGKFLAIETKKAKGSYGTTEDQEAFIDMINSKGGVAFVARSVNEVAQILSERVG